MRFLQNFVLVVASITQLASARGQPLKSRQIQSLSNALSQYADLSTFNSLINSQPSILGNITTGSDHKVTLLAPTNDAITNFLRQSNISDVTLLPADRLLAILQYHTLDAGLTTTNFSAPRGITVPTKLRDTIYNLRSPGPAIINQYGDEAQGQVLFVSQDTINPAKFRVRQDSSSDKKTANLRAGLGQNAELTALDGEWDGGYFHSIDAVLETPKPCSTTIRKLSDSLSSLADAFDKTKLWQTVDKLPNVTCLGPNAQAFNEAGSPEKSLGKDDLKNALLFHTLPQVTYTDFLTDGQEFTSYANVTVRVTIRGDEIWFNDAKVVSPNVLTNNGLIHVLDRVMSANAAPPSPSSTTSPTGSSTASPTSTSTPPNAGNPVAGNLRVAAVVALAVGVLIA